MQTREEAIAYLREHGFHAVARDWGMGETIAVFVQEGVIYLYPSECGWSISPPIVGASVNLYYSSLFEAVVAVEEIIPRRDKWIKDLCKKAETEMDSELGNSSNE